MSGKSQLLIIGPSVKSHGIGGVTVHVQRLRNYMDKVGYAYHFVDYKDVHPMALLYEISKAHIVHLHVSNPVYQYFIVLFGRLLGKKIIMTLHGNYGRFGFFKNCLVRSAIEKASVPIVINEHSYRCCQKINKNLHLIPAFIPPQKEESLQKDILVLLEKIHKKGMKIVSTNAYNISIDKDGNDTYGIDFLVGYFKDSVDMALLVSDPSGNYHKKYNVGENTGKGTCSVFFIDYPHPYFELLKHVDCFVRNTSTDGDALSVKEALFLGVPTICTDVVDRPDGVVTFKYSDKESFEKSLRNLSYSSVNIENGAKKIIELYKEIERNK